jgi:MoxR-like ATPase
MEGRDYVIPEDVQAVLPGVIRHRLGSALVPAPEGDVDIAAALIREVAIP